MGNVFRWRHSAILLDRLREATSTEDTAQLAKYAELRNKGLKAEAQTVLDAWISKLKQFPLNERFARLASLISQSVRVGDFEIPLPGKIYLEFAEPLFAIWQRENPNDLRGYKWSNNELHWTLALSIDPSDEFTRFRIIFSKLQMLDHALHELPELFCAPIYEIDKLIEDCESLIAASPQTEVFQRQSARILEARALVERHRYDRNTIKPDGWT